jgi:hypothetical protein
MHKSAVLREVRAASPNLANSRGYSVKEVITVAEKVCGRSIPLETASRRSGDPADSNRGDAGQARRLLGWKPMHSDLETPRNHNRVLSTADRQASCRRLTEDKVFRPANIEWCQKPFDKDKAVIVEKLSDIGCRKKHGQL